jgi:tRNA (guanine37-N1)-methyltransferase
LLREQVNTFPSGAIFLCGRYEGIDERVIEYWRENEGLQEISMGDFILTGGEIPAMAFIDSWVRLLPGVLEKADATTNESFELDLLEFPQYTKPRIWQDTVVPEVLLSGDHKKIAAWQQNEAEIITQERRPDLWERFCLKQSVKPNIGFNKPGE